MSAQIVSTPTKSAKKVLQRAIKKSNEHVKAGRVRAATTAMSRGALGARLLLDNDDVAAAESRRIHALFAAKQTLMLTAGCEPDVDVVDFLVPSKIALSAPWRASNVLDSYQQQQVCRAALVLHLYDIDSVHDGVYYEFARYLYFLGFRAVQ